MNVCFKMDATFYLEKIIEETELTQEELEQLIEERKEAIGMDIKYEFLLFIIGKELGVNIEDEKEEDLKYNEYFKDYFCGIIKKNTNLTDNEIQNKIKEIREKRNINSDTWALHNILSDLKLQDYLYNGPKGDEWRDISAKRLIRGIISKELITIELFNLNQEKRNLLLGFLEQNSINFYRHYKGDRTLSLFTDD